MVITLRSTFEARVITWLVTGLALVLVTGLAACSPGSKEAAPAAAEPAAAATDSGAPRVFFVSPAEGATVGTLVKLQFGAENFTIEPVGEGMVHAGAGHYHIGVDTDCLEPGVVIPKADPWIHFGDGSSEIEIQLEPGPHQLALQIGDGEHRTLAEPGFCAILHVTVSEEADEEEDEG